MKNDHKTLEELQRRIAAAQKGGGVDQKLIADVVAYAEARKAEGAALDDVAAELGVPNWQLMDWVELAKKRSDRLAEPARGTLKLMVELPLGGVFMESLLTDDLSLTDLADDMADWLKEWAEKSGESS